MKNVIFAVAAMIAVTGCTTAEQDATVGGGIGAAVGALATGDAGGAIVGGAVGEVEHVVDVVADQEDADAFRLELLHQFADLGGLLRPESGGRLVHDQNA